MKNWLKAFFLGFFCHRHSKASTKLGYSNIFLAFALAMVFLWAGFVGGDMLPFNLHYQNSPSFQQTAQAVFANSNPSNRLVAVVENGDLKVAKSGGEFVQQLFVNTFENEEDKQTYSVGGCHVVVDTRPASTLAEVEAVCVSNDGKNTVISYEDYLGLSDVAKLNFDFKLNYTGRAFELTTDLVETYKQYLEGLGNESTQQAQNLATQLAQNKLTTEQYNREIYQLYFSNYYPSISAYESTSKVPLLRNYYYHNYISQGANNYLLVFDDYVTGAFQTKNGVDVAFYGFYNDLPNGSIVADGATQSQAQRMVDDFVKQAFHANLYLNCYAHAMNVFSLVPFVALMLMVASILSSSLLKLMGVESVQTLGEMFKVVGAYTWICGAIGAVFAIAIGFFARKSSIVALSLVAFFVALIARCIVFVLKEKSLHKQLQQQKTEQAGG